MKLKEIKKVADLEQILNHMLSRISDLEGEVISQAKSINTLDTDLDILTDAVFDKVAPDTGDYDA